MNKGKRYNRTDVVDLGVGGGPKLKEYLYDAAGKQGIGLMQLVASAYKTAGITVENPYDTVKRWFGTKKSKGLRVNLQLFEAILTTVGCHSITAYPHLPSNERDRLHTRKRLLSDEPSTSDFLAFFDIVDLSYEIRPEPSCGFLKTWVPVRTKPQHGESAGIQFETTVLRQLPTNYGTHIDFPGHLPVLADSRAVSEFPLDSFIREAVVVDVRDCLNEHIFRHLDENNLLPADAFGLGEHGLRKLFDHIQAMEISKETFLSKCAQEIKGKAVLFCTGLDRYWRYERQPGWRYAYFLNPFLSEELASFLVDQHVSIIGSDTLQLECPLFNIDPKEDFPTCPEIWRLCKELQASLSGSLIHRTLLENSVCIIENLRQLTEILPGPVIFVGAPLKFGHPVSDNSPTRAFAFVPRKQRRHEREPIAKGPL